MPFEKTKLHKPDYVYQAEFLRLYDITYTDTKDMMSGGQMNYEVDRHGRAWIPVKEGERLGIVRKDPPELMPSAYTKKAPTTIPMGTMNSKVTQDTTQLTKTEFCNTWTISRPTLDEWIKAGKISVEKDPTGRTKIDKAEAIRLGLNARPTYGLAQASKPSTTNLSATIEIIKIVRSLKEERDQLRKQVEEFNNLMSELKKAI